MASQFGISAGAANTILKMKLEYENLGDSLELSEHPSIGGFMFTNM